MLARARIEFEEELGIPASGHWLELGSVKQKGGKIVHAWAFSGDLDKSFELASNTFEMEWPPRSGKMQRFPEVDRASFFPVGEAREKINAAQAVFLDRLIELLDARNSAGGGKYPSNLSREILLAIKLASDNTRIFSDFSGRNLIRYG